MMGEIVSDVRAGLMEVFFGVYKKDAARVLSALQQLGVIKSTGDTFALKRTVAFFLDNFTKQTERGETLKNIGEDLFSIALDQPFRFPATFTFVVRAFSTLEGIGKSLSKDYKFSGEFLLRHSSSSASGIRSRWLR